MPKAVPLTTWPAERMQGTNRNLLEAMNQANQMNMLRERLSAERGNMVLGSALNLGTGLISDSFNSNLAMERDTHQAQLSSQSIQERARLALDNEFIAKYGAGVGDLQQEADATLDAAVYKTPGDRLRTYVQGLDQKRAKTEFDQKVKLGMEALDTQQQRDLGNIDKAVNEVKSAPHWEPAFEGDNRREQMLEQLEQQRLGIIMGAYQNAASGRSRRGSAALQQQPEWVQEQHPELGWVQRNPSTGEVKPISAGAGSSLRAGGGSGAGGSGKTAPGAIPTFKSPQERVNYYMGAASSHVDEAVKTAGGFEIETEVPEVVDGVPSGKMSKGKQLIGPADPRYKDVKKNAIIAEATARMEAEDALAQIEAQRAMEMQSQAQIQEARQRSLERIATFQDWAPLEMPGVRLPAALGGSAGPTQANADWERGGGKNPGPDQTPVDNATMSLLKSVAQQDTPQGKAIRAKLRERGIEIPEPGGDSPETKRAKELYDSVFDTRLIGVTN